MRRIHTEARGRNVARREGQAILAALRAKHDESPAIQAQSQTLPARFSPLPRPRYLSITRVPPCACTLRLKQVHACCAFLS
jgi:hypothetical protein